MSSYSHSTWVSFLSVHSSIFTWLIGAVKSHFPSCPFKPTSTVSRAVQTLAQIFPNDDEYSCGSDILQRLHSTSFSRWWVLFCCTSFHNDRTSMASCITGILYYVCLMSICITNVIIIYTLPVRLFSIYEKAPDTIPRNYYC